jgi:hypothetical protein
MVKQSHLKGEVTVVIAPYTPEYNESLKANAINQDNDEDQDDLKEENPKELEKLSIIDIYICASKIS